MNAEQIIKAAVKVVIDSHFRIAHRCACGFALGGGSTKWAVQRQKHQDHIADEVAKALAQSSTYRKALEQKA